MSKMTIITQVYPIKLPQEDKLRERVDYLKQITMEAGQQLLERLWSEGWLDIITSDDREKKVYKIIGEHQTTLTKEGKLVYLPSRIRRCITERVGRIIRSQAVRRQCYEDVIRVAQITGMEGNLDQLVKTVAYTLIFFEGKYYRWALIRQTMRTLRRYYYRLGLDLAVLATIPYTKQVTPVIHSFCLPYSPDDSQAIELTWQQEKIAVKIKLPTIAYPVTRGDWIWHELSLTVPKKVLQRITQASGSEIKIHPPTLRYKQLKGGLVLPFLEVPWSSLVSLPQPVYPKRALATDLGLVNLTTSVICEAGSQISRPDFWSPASSLLSKIDRLYTLVQRIQKQKDHFPDHCPGQTKRALDLNRLYRKLNRYRENILHQTSNHLIAIATKWQCSTIVLEDLRAYKPPKGRRTLSRKLSNWLRGSLFDILSYKARRVGLRVVRVSARWTSSYCPRCGQKGSKIVDPCSSAVSPKGRFFSCPFCSFSADRDYIASLNVYRMYENRRQKRFALRFAKPVSYMGAGFLRDRPRGAAISFPRYS